MEGRRIFSVKVHKENRENNGAMKSYMQINCTMRILACELVYKFELCSPPDFYRKPYTCPY